MFQHDYELDKIMSLWPKRNEKGKEKKCLAGKKKKE